MRNYFKAVSGRIVDQSMKQDVFFFNDGDLGATREACAHALDFGGDVSVYRMSVGVPAHILLIGEVPETIQAS